MRVNFHKTPFVGCGHKYLLKPFNARQTVCQTPHRSPHKDPPKNFSKKIFVKVRICSCFNRIYGRKQKTGQSGRYFNNAERLARKEQIMKKRNLLATIGSLSLVTALSFGVVACAANSDSGNQAGNKHTFSQSGDFFAVSAASGASFLNAESGNATAKKRHALNAEQSVTGGETLVRPAEFTDENVKEIKNCLVMFDSVVGGGVSSKIEECGESDGEYSVYAYKMTVNFGGETAVMYYNETATKTEIDEDDDGIETETKTTLSGVLLSGENVYEALGKREEEISSDEQEFELELIVKKSAKDYIKFAYSTENEANENETEYECEIYENGVRVQKTEIEIEEENGKTEIKFELEKGGKKDGIEYKIVKRTENKFDISRKQNKKKSYILAEKIADGYTFTYSNGFSEAVPFAA